MTHKLIKTENYLLVVNDSVHPYDSSKVGNPLAHLPLKGSPILEGVVLLPPIQDDVEKLAEDYVTEDGKYGLHDDAYRELLSFTAGYNKAREKFRYTEEDVRKALLIKHDGLDTDYVIEVISSKYPTEFECETEPYTVGEMSEMPLGTVNQKPKTITTSQGIQWVGKYVF